MSNDTIISKTHLNKEYFKMNDRFTIPLWKVFFGLLFLLEPLPQFATIESIHSIGAINFTNIPENQVLAVFDIDDTLTILHEGAFQRLNFKFHHVEIFNEIMKPLSVEEKLIAFTLPLLMTPGDLIEIQTPEVIKNLQEKGVRTIALTAAMAGKIGDVFIEDQRIAELKRSKIDFSSSFPDLQERIYSNFRAPIIGSYPLFKRGIIFSNDNDKGAVLVEFLKTISWLPDLILFVDDRIDHLYSVEKELYLFNPNIQFKGYHFQTDLNVYKEVDPEHFKEKWLQCVEQAKEILSFLFLKPDLYTD